MHKHPFLTLVALNVLITLVAPASWLAPICAVLLAPLVCGILAAHFFARRPFAVRALLLVAIITVGAVLRPYWWAAMWDHDFTFDNEPEVEFEVAFIQFVIAGFAFLVSSLCRRVPPPNNALQRTEAGGGVFSPWRA